MITLKEVVSQPGREIKIKIKNVYGNDLMYPDCELSEFASKLVKKKTFDAGDINNLKEMGFNVILDGVRI